MMDAELRAAIWPIFIEEAREHLQQLGGAILEMERVDPARPKDLTESACRTAHSLKGSAASVGLAHVEKIAHAVEDVIEHCPATDALAPQAIRAALRGLEAMRDSLDRGDRGEPTEVPDFESVMDVLRQAAEQLRQGTQPAVSERVEHSSSPAPTEKVPPPSVSTDSPSWTLELWPVFRQEVDEQLVHMRRTLEEGGSGPLSPEALTALNAHREHIYRSAQTLELPVLLEASAATPDSSETPEQHWRAKVLRLEAAFLQVDLAHISAEPVADVPPALLPEDAGGTVGVSPAADVPAPRTLESGSPTQAPAAADPHGRKPSTGAEVAPAGKAGERSIRVSTLALDSLSEQVELLLGARPRQRRRTVEVKALGEMLTSVLASCQKATALVGTAEAAELRQMLRTSIQDLMNVQRRLGRLGRESSSDDEEVHLLSTVVKEDLRDIRMVAASTLLEPLRLTARDVANRLEKQVQVLLHGGEVRLDRRIVDELKDPLLHLVRNAIDHGLESPSERTAAGKGPQGTLQISVAQRGDRIALEISEDGRGLSFDRIRETAVRKGLISAESAAALSDGEASRLIFMPGFSTASQVTAISGRGVGLDVVQERITRLLGTVRVQSTPGQGTRFILDVPLTLSATLALVVSTGGEPFALPIDSVNGLRRIRPKDLAQVGPRTVVRVEDRHVPFLSMSDVLGLPQTELALHRGEDQVSVVIRAGPDSVVFAVDEIIGQQEIVIHPLPKQAGKLPHYRGAAVLDDARIVPVLNGHALVRATQLSAAARTQGRPRILVADDSVTTRTLIKSMLELAGYDVLPASDGLSAYELLRRNPCRLLVTDVQMPHLDGFELTRKVRSDAAIAGTPVILVTSLETQEDRSQGFEAGANAYLVKQDIERGKLLDVVRQLVGDRA